ncbi:MAG TPA: tRNA uracil 4-sulfurtransferase ThiI [Polyangia bacterium]|nr:tRNA uracil 4-sulfurtransferase ThiI [Polyangia bacterium]
MSDSPSGEVVLVRWGEIFLKGGNRAFFERRLAEAARRALAPLEGARIERLHGRLLAWPGPDDPGALRALRALEKVFGVTSLSPARVVERKLEAISAAAVELARGEAARRGRPRFKVETRRSDKRFQPTSPEVSRLVGAAIVGALDLPVDVHTPELTVGVEIGTEHAFVFGSSVPGPGGLPVGVTGRVELLLSGGIDSPVAGWLMLKRGCELGATYFHSFPYTGDHTKEKVIALARKLAAWQLADVRLAVVPFTDAQKKLRDTGDGRLAVVLYRRMMMRVAERIARASKAQALVTGEALAQVASQTLENLTAIGAAATLPILRPCLGHDKLDTIAIAERIGTYETSILPFDDCCSLFVPEHPITKARLDDVLAAESKVDVAAIVDACIAGVETIVCSA